MAGRRTAAVLVTAATGGLLLLAFASAAGGAAELGEPRVGAGWVRGAAEGLADAMQGSDEGAPARQPVRGDETPWALIVIGVVGTALAALVLRTLRPARDDGRRPGDVSRPALPDLDDSADRTLTALRRSARSAAADLAVAGPRQARDAVVAAWLALEEAAAAGGTRRHPAQTPTEFTVALLGGHAADPAAVDELLRLYHRARFGSAALPADAGERAARALGVIAASLDGARRG